LLFIVIILGQKYFCARSPVEELEKRISQIPRMTSISNESIKERMRRIAPHLVIICTMVIILVRSFSLKNYKVLSKQL
jgi:hypothetical protein